MSELPGLPAFGAEPAFAGTDAAYDTVVGRALGRRRRRAATTASATALAVVAVVTLSHDPTGRASLHPAGPLPSTPTTTPWAGPTPPYVPGEPTPTTTTAPDGSPAATAPAAASPMPGRTGAPDPTVQPDGPHEQWIAAGTQVVSDSAPGQNCEKWGYSDGWCFRYIGPVSARTGTPVTFTSELCRIPGGRSASRVDFDYVEENLVSVMGRDEDGDYRRDNTAKSWGRSGPTKRPHSREVALGTCLRWPLTWNGISAEGRQMPARSWTYSLGIHVLGVAPRAPLPGDGDQSDETFFIFDTAFTILP